MTQDVSNNPTSALRAARQRGFTLVELMVSLAISLFVLAAVLSIYLSTKSTFNSQDQMAQLQDSERLVLTMLTTTIQSAGYFVDPLTNTAAVALPAATVTRADGTSTAFLAGEAVMGTGNGSGTGASSDTVTVRYQTASGDGLMNCQGTPNTSGANAIAVNYFSVNATNDLTCTVGTGSPVVLASNVGQLSILYGVDTSGTGNMDAYLPASAVTTAALWGSVYTAQVSIGFLDTTASKTGSPVLMPKPVVQTINLMNRQ
ncbi:MAG: prepilin-type N-terminal cleavage/methylation domain-containing protein [Alcaligenaceae bacterium]|nr:MAG: prepilin-type N-terminal cleavage/methylation domain-containing protein [Alcaligenaceae bacterium]